MSLLQMSVSSAILILVVIVIRAVAINKLPKAAFLALWGIVLLKLLIPFSIPSTFSVYSIISYNKGAATVEQLPAGDFAPVVEDIPTTFPAGMASTSENAISPLFVIWLTGMVLCTSFFIIAYLRCRFEFSTSLPVRNAFVESWLQEHLIMRPIDVRQSDRISAPLTYGIFKPVILVPRATDWQNTKQLNYVFLHEYVHIRRFDTITKLICAFALCVHWFNPLVWVMYILFNRDLELACDERVVRLFGETSKKDYSLMLISMEAKKSGLLPFCNSFSKNAMEERITAIMKMKKITIFSLILACLAVLGVAITFATSSTDETYVVAYLKNISDETLTVDIVEFITEEDEKRITELQLTEDDMPDGYYIHNPEETTVTWKLTSKTKYTFIDWNGDFSESEYPQEYTTTNVQDFITYIKTYENGMPGMPFFFQIKKDTVKLILEKPFA